MRAHRSPGKALKAWAAVLSIVLLLLLVAGGTLTFLMANTDAVDNQFEEVSVICQVNRSGDVFNVTNKGNINAYVRAFIVVNWMDDEGNIRGLAPEDGEFTLQLNTHDWYLLNGYYYYLQPVAPNQNTTDLLTGITITGTVPDSYQLSVEVAAEAIQAEGVTSDTDTQAILDAWGSSIEN